MFFMIGHATGAFPLQAVSSCEVQQNLSFHLEEGISCMRMIGLKTWALTLRRQKSLKCLKNDGAVPDFE